MTQVLGTRESGSAPSGSQAKSSGAPQQAARQPDEAMSSGASGWVKQPAEEMRGPASGRAQEGRRSPDEVTEVNGFGPDSYVLR